MVVVDAERAAVLLRVEALKSCEGGQRKKRRRRVGGAGLVGDGGVVHAGEEAWEGGRDRS